MESTSPRPTNIAIICDSFRHGRGYQENNLFTYLQWAGHNIFVFSARSNNQGLPPPVKPRATEHCVASKIRLRQVWPKVRFQHEALDNAAVVFILGNKTFAASLLAAMSPPGPQGRRIFSFFQDHPGTSHTLGQRIKHFASDTLYPFLHRAHSQQIVDASERVVLNTPDSKAYLCQAGVKFPTGSNAPVLLPLGISTEFFGPQRLERASQVRQELGIDSEAPTILVGGRYTPEKRVMLDQLFANIDEVIQTNADARMLIVGYPQASCDGFKLQGRSTFFGFVDQSKYADLMAIADICIFTQPSIGIQQALATGCVVIAPATPTLNFLGQYGEILFYDDGRLGSTLTDTLASVQALRKVRQERAESNAHRLTFSNHLETLGLSL